MCWRLIADLARAEGTTFQIANDVRRTQRRVNALNHVLIPMYRNITKKIELVLEEKDREEFVRTKRIKHMIKEHEVSMSLNFKNTKNILIPTDGSDYSLRAAEYGISIAKMLGAQIMVVYVIG